MKFLFSHRLSVHKQLHTWSVRVHLDGDVSVRLLWIYVTLVPTLDDVYHVFPISWKCFVTRAVADLAEPIRLVPVRCSLGKPTQIELAER
jgi:hypothetical protein